MFGKRKIAPPTQTVLSPYDYARIERCIVSEQLDFFKDVLLVSLRIVQSGVNAQGEAVFKAIFDAVLTGLKRVYDYIEPRKTSISRANMNAQLAFTFYRILYQQTAHCMATADGFTPLRLFKRLPSKLALYLGDQDWRLYEFYTVVICPLEQCVVNADLIEQLVQYTAGCCPQAVSATQSTAPHVATAAPVALPEKAVKTTAVTQVATPPTVIPTTPIAITPPAKPVATVSSQQNAPQAPTPMVKTPPATQPAVDVGETLRDWALKNTAKENKRFAINGGLYFYASPLAFGEKTLFINQAGIQHFLRSHTATKAAILASPIVQEGYVRQSDSSVLYAITLAVVLTNIRGSEPIIQKEVTP